MFFLLLLANILNRLCVSVCNCCIYPQSLWKNWSSECISIIKVVHNTDMSFFLITVMIFDLTFHGQSSHKGQKPRIHRNIHTLQTEISDQNPTNKLVDDSEWALVRIRTTASTKVVFSTRKIPDTRTRVCRSAQRTHICFPAINLRSPPRLFWKW